jgi:hypothetical protein
VFDAVGMRQIAHLLGDFPGLGSVVYFGEYVAVDVNHGAVLDLSRLARKEKALTTKGTKVHEGIKFPSCTFVPLVVKALTGIASA